MRNIRGIALGLALGLALPACYGVAHSTDAPIDLKWAALVPVDKPQLPTHKAFFNGSVPVVPGSRYEAPPPDKEAKWMSGAGRVTASSAPVPIVHELDGKRVKIGGYVVPLDFDAQKVTEFLLVPFVGACIHVPPPPANQIVYVKAPMGITLKGEFDPVYVTGTLSTEGQFTGIAETGYSIVADSVDSRKE